MSQRASLAAVGAAAVLVEVALGAAVLSADGPSRIAQFLLASAVATALIVAMLWWILGLPPRDDDGGGGPRTDPPSPPPWWPEFESEFRRHARERDTSRV